MSYQTTIKRRVSCSGIGLHTGKQIWLSIRPALANRGITFIRTDIACNILINHNSVFSTKLGTTIIDYERNGSISTVEHLMCALYLTGIDNCIVELNGPEIPIMDGSAKPFIDLIYKSGIHTFNQTRKEIYIMKDIEVFHKDSYAKITPYDNESSITVEIDFKDNIVGRQKNWFDLSNKNNLMNQIADSRTFAFENEIKEIKKAGLGKGGSLDNAIVIGDKSVMNPEGLRSNHEFVKHKTLDCLGDLYLAGYRINGHFDFYKPGHTINNMLLCKLFSNSSNYRLCSEEQFIAPIFQC